MVRFEKGKLPPANAFWFITLNDNEGFQVPNAIDRFAIGNRDKLTFNADGSLDIHVQHESPGAGRELNWLPAPTGAFNLVMRVYSPKRELLDGGWVPPPLKKAT